MFTTPVDRPATPISKLSVDSDCLAIAISNLTLNICKLTRFKCRPPKNLKKQSITVVRLQELKEVVLSQ
jgi:hypothetical protein